MESVGAICEGEWNGMCSDEADFMEQLLGNCSLPGAAAVSCFWPGNESNVKNDHGVEAESSMANNNASMFSFSLGNTTNIFPSNFVNNNSLMAMDYCVNMELGDDFLNDSDESQEKSFKEEDKISSSPAYEISSKRPRIPAQLLSQRSKRSKKCPKVDENENVALHRQSSSGCYSEDDSNEANGMNSSSSSKRSSGPQNSNGKPRATRGSATDPQSLYARKRRERINERLKVLQSLVPNGTKVDISTMLEEAVQYVNFLQLQIKLLSSDDLWMYSPIAYNGMDLGLDLKFPSLKPQS